jgi:hypothetical protein
MATVAEDFDFVGSYNNQRIANIDSERTINCFEYHDARAKKPKSLVGTSGLLNTGFVFPNCTGGVRGEYVFNNVHYIVVGGFTGVAGGSSVFSVTPSGASSLALIGNIPTSTTGYVGIDANTYQVTFVDGQGGYVYDTIAQTFQPITDPAFPTAPLDICYLDGFTIVIQGGTNQFEMSSLYQSLIWGPDNNGSLTSFTMAAGSPNIVMTYSGGSIANYQVGTPIQFSGGGLPAELVAGQTYFVKSIVNATTITVSATSGGMTITSVAGGAGSLTNNGQLQQGQVNSHPGTLVACRTLHRRVFFFSQFFIEPWENAGIGTNLPLRRNNSLLIENGTFAAANVTVDFDIMCYVSQTRGGLGSVMLVSGTESIPISTRALNTQLGTYASQGHINDCRTFLIKEQGLIFFRMNFTMANHTFVYNVSQSRPDVEGDETKYWHEEEVLNGNRHPAQTHAYFNGLNYAGDYHLPILYQISPNVYQNNGENIRRARIGKPIMVPGGNRRRVDRIVFDFQQGNVALENNPIANVPYVFLSISKDGGQTYGYKQKAPLGKIGQRTFRTVYRKLGVIPREQAFVPLLEWFTPIPFVCLGASWASEVLPQ